MQKQTRTFATVMARGTRGDEPSIAISTIALDRDQDEIVPEGGDFTAYLQNPAVLYGHDYNSLPVGSTTKLDVTPGRGVMARWTWLENDAFADRVKNAFDQGVLRAASIGFLPLETEPNGFGGTRFKRWQLLEWSLVAVPANPQAVRTLKALDLWDDNDTVLVLDDEPAVDVITFAPDAVAAAQAALSRQRRKSEPFEPTLDIDPQVFAGAVKDAFRSALREAVPALVKAELARARGRVD